jgi:hypothetical protein
LREGGRERQEEGTGSEGQCKLLLPMRVVKNERARRGGTKRVQREREGEAEAEDERERVREGEEEREGALEREHEGE